MPMLPSKREREINLGAPKAPKMGKLSPQTVEVPSVDDLLAQLNAVAPAAYQVAQHCGIKCQCGPCRVGACQNCVVEEMGRNGATLGEIMDAKEMFGRP